MLVLLLSLQMSLKEKAMAKMDERTEKIGV